MAEYQMNSPWGTADEWDELCPGVYSVSTPSHDGTMVERNAAVSLLSPAARKCGEWYGGYLCFEEDCAEAVVLWELYHRKVYIHPMAEKEPQRFEEIITNSLKRYYPEYLQTWQKGQRPRRQSQVRRRAAER